MKLRSISEADFLGGMFTADMTFIYTPKHQLVTGPGDEGHSNLAVEYHPEMFPEQIEALYRDGDPGELLDYLQQKCTCGRLSTKRKTIWIWGEEHGRTVVDLTGTLKALLQTDIAQDDWLVKVSNGDNQSIASALQGRTPQRGEVLSATELLGYAPPPRQRKSELERRREYWPTSEGVSPLLATLNALRPKFAAAAQATYDEWQPDEFDSGGICDLVAEALGGVLGNAGIDYIDGGQDGDDHAYIIAYDDRESYVVDIPYDMYETGSGYAWKKVEGAMFSPLDVQIEPVHRPDWI